MNTPSAIELLLEKIKLLEIELIEELQNQHREFTGEFYKRQVVFSEKLDSSDKCTGSIS